MEKRAITQGESETTVTVEDGRHRNKEEVAVVMASLKVTESDVEMYHLKRTDGKYFEALPNR